jgi:hypothetical protein
MTLEAAAGGSNRRLTPTWVRSGGLVAAVVAGALAAPGLLAPLSGSTYDGGITASAGTFILHGRLPYRDFWMLYGPLTGYLAAGMTALLGNEIWVLRLAGLLIVMATTVLGYGLVGARLPMIPRVATAVIAGLIPVYNVGLDLGPWALAMALALGAILVIRSGGKRSLLLAGVLIGLASLVRLDVGAYCLIAAVIATRDIRPAAWAAAVVLPVAAMFMLAVPLDSLVEQLIWYPVVGPRSFRGIPPPALWAVIDPEWTFGWLLYWPPLGLIVLAIARRVRSGSIPREDLALLTFAVLCRLQTLGRADADHSAQAAIPAILLVGYVFSGDLSRVGRLTLALATGLFIAIAALPLIWLVAPRDPYDAALTAAVDYVRDHTAPDEPIFAGEVRNRYALLNPLLVYYLADRPSGVRDTMYNPGVTTTARTQQRMVVDLRAARVRYLILDVRWADCRETSNLSSVPGATILDDAIGHDYRVEADFGAVVIMGRRDQPPDIVATNAWADPTPLSGIPYLVCQRGSTQP